MKIKQHVHAQVKPVPGSAGTVRSITFERDWFSLRHLSHGKELSAGTEVTATLFCTAGQSQCCFFYWCGCSKNVHFPAPPGQSPAQPGKWAFPASCLPNCKMRKCFLISETLGSVPEARRKKLRAAEKKWAVFAWATPMVAAGAPGYSLFLLISFYVSARSLKRVMES